MRLQRRDHGSPDLSSQPTKESKQFGDQIKEDKSIFCQTECSVRPDKTRRAVKRNSKCCKVLKRMESVVFQDHGIYRFYIKKIHQLWPKKFEKNNSIKCHKISKEFTT